MVDPNKIFPKFNDLPPQNIEAEQRVVFRKKWIPPRLNGLRRSLDEIQAWQNPRHGHLIDLPQLVVPLPMRVLEPLVMPPIVVRQGNEFASNSDNPL